MDSKTTSFRLSRHGSVRMEQRGIKADMVRLVLSQGQVIRKQGLRYYYVPKSFATNWERKEQEAVRDLIVITDKSGAQLITCYRNPQAVKAIKRKTKYLCKGKLN
ncbi:DUF4258 domain-containing protein [Algoriphagus sp.]|uniref:DUF4258 domain-containing protein n=1 Tax=Algoriphagus sp. TaxID=1872435 RepID=UPI003918FC5E